MNSRVPAFLAFALLVLAPACQRSVVTGPPELRPGRDQCAHCGMMISDDRFAGALVVEQDGIREALLFDDIGCLLDFRSSVTPKQVVCGRFVRDFAERRWIDATVAKYLVADRRKLATPMGSGIVAFANYGAADGKRLQVGGAIVDDEALVGARAEASPSAGIP